MPYICYVDEAGCTTPLPTNPKTDIQPLLVIAGLIVPQDKVGHVTREFLTLKRRFFPGNFHSVHYLDDIRDEIKGSDVRTAIRKKGHRASAQLKFADSVLTLLQSVDAKLIACIWVKGLGKPIKERPVYTMSVQSICRHFQCFLNQQRDTGVIIADFRTTQLNDRVAHSIFTQKYRAKGDPFANILELPSFGVSNNHAGLQIADLLCSTLLFPLASATYCKGHVTGVHVNRHDAFLKRRYVKRLKRMQLRSNDGLPEPWSVRVRDKLAKRSSREFFLLPPTGIAKAVSAVKSAAAAAASALTGNAPTK